MVFIPEDFISNCHYSKKIIPKGHYSKDFIPKIFIPKSHYSEFPNNDPSE